MAARPGKCQLSLAAMIDNAIDSKAIGRFLIGYVEECWPGMTVKGSREKIRMMPHQAGRQQPVALREYLRKTVINYRQQSQTQPEGKDPIYQKDDLPYTRPVFA